MHAGQVASDPLWNREQAAAYLGLKASTLAVWASRKSYGLPFLKVGRLVKYRKSDLDQWLETRQQTHAQ